jgi:hypothetical protein
MARVGSLYSARGAAGDGADAAGNDGAGDEAHGPEHGRDEHEEKRETELAPERNVEVEGEGGKAEIGLEDGAGRGGAGR